MCIAKFLRELCNSLIFCLFRSCCESFLPLFVMFRVFAAFLSFYSFEFARLLGNTLKYWFSFLGRESCPCPPLKTDPPPQVCWGVTSHPLLTSLQVLRVTVIVSRPSCITWVIILLCVRLSAFQAFTSSLHHRVCSRRCASCCASLTTVSMTFTSLYVNAGLQYCVQCFPWKIVCYCFQHRSTVT